MTFKRVLYIIATWPFNDRDDYDRWIGAQVPIPAWVILGLVGALVYAFVRKA